MKPKTIYYSTGEVEEVDEYADGNLTKSTVYHKETGQIEEVDEYIDGSLKKSTCCNKSGQVVYVKSY